MKWDFQLYIAVISVFGSLSMLLGIAFYVYVIIPLLNQIGRMKERDKERSVIYRGIFVRFR